MLILFQCDCSGCNVTFVKVFTPEEAQGTNSGGERNLIKGRAGRVM